MKLHIEHNGKLYTIHDANITGYGYTTSINGLFTVNVSFVAPIELVGHVQQEPRQLDEQQNTLIVGGAEIS